MKNLSNLKFVVMAMFVALLSLSLTACSDDDDDKKESSKTEPSKTESSIVGTWKYTESGIDWSETVTLTINSNGTFIMSVRGIDNGQEYNETERGTYTIKGSTITIAYDDEDIKVCTYSISGNTLTISSDGEVMSFKKV